MIRLIQVCEKCEKETLSSDEGDGIIEINYKTKTMQFMCPFCLYNNVIDFGVIQAALDRRTKLPSVGSSRF